MPWNMRIYKTCAVRLKGSKRIIFEFLNCKIWIFLFLVRVGKRKCDLEKPHEYWVL